MNLLTLAENLGICARMLEDHDVKLSNDATGEVVEAHGFKLGLCPVKAAALGERIRTGTVGRAPCRHYQPD